MTVFYKTVHSLGFSDWNH